MSSDIAISVENVSKAYRIWNDPGARLKSPLVGACGGLFPRSSALRQKCETKAAGFYRDFYALKDISFQVRQGESVGIIGRNGSGKSTLLQIIAGTLQPTTGSVSVSGRVAALLELGSGFNPDFTGRENVYLNAAVLGLTRTETDTKFDNIAAFADIGDFIDQPVKTYSSGMMVRLAFAVQTAINPEILIVDEALAVGDEPFQRKCFNEIALLQERGTSILFVSHATATLVEICDRVILLDRGEQLLTATPKVVVQQYHHLCYASAENRAIVRSEIAKLGVGSRTAPTACERGQPTGVRPHIDSSDKSPESGQQEAYFLETLMPASRMEYPAHGALIERAGFFDRELRAVNVLVKGADYILRWNVRFSAVATRVRCGWTVKTMSGIVISGAATHPIGDGIPEYSANTVVEVTFRFRCLFTPGTYFVDLGVRGQAEQPDSILHGINDALMFKVQPVANEHRNGYMDCTIEPVWSLIPTESDSNNQPTALNQ